MGSYNERMPVPDCPRCGGSGWLIRERNGISAADRCPCELAGRAQVIEDRASIPPLFAGATLDNFVLPQDNPVARNALATVMVQVRKYANDFPVVDRPGLLFIGDPGCGKTHLAVSVLKILIHRGFEGVFSDYQNLLERIRAGYDPASGSSDKEAYRTALDAEILVLDDLGAHRVTEWVEDTVTSIVNHRYNQRKPLIATTNLPDPDAHWAGSGSSRGVGNGSMGDHRVKLAERIGMRARSRLFEMCRVIQMPAVEDYRVRRARV